MSRRPQHGPAAGGEPDLEPVAGDLYLGAIGHAHRYTRRARPIYYTLNGTTPDDEFFALQRRARRLQMSFHDHGRGDRGRERLQQQRRDQRHLHDHRAARNEPGQRQSLGVDNVTGIATTGSAGPATAAWTATGMPTPRALLGTSLSWNGSTLHVRRCGIRRCGEQRDHCAACGQ